jgi:hypothetical protein
VNAYIENLQATLSVARFVAEPHVSVDDRGEIVFVRADIYFADGSLLHFRELWVGRGKWEKKTYVYHYQNAAGALIFRYDNTPHFPNLSTAPHHKHDGEQNVVAAKAPDLQQVLDEIETMLASKEQN